MRRILVTGGAGFIGSYSVERLLAGGHQVVVLDNFSSGEKDNLSLNNSRLEVIEGDVRDLAAVRKATRGVTHCLHLAAQGSVAKSMEDPGGSASHNIVGLVNILNMAGNGDMERIVYASSAAVYGSNGLDPLHEGVALHPESPYGLEKQVNELYVNLFRGLRGVSTCGLRYFNVYGYDRNRSNSQYSGVISSFVHAITTGEPLIIYGDGMQIRDFVHVDDVARVNAAVLASGCQGVFNVATGIPKTLIEVVEMLEKITGRKSNKQFRPAREGDIRNSSANVSALHEAVEVDIRYSLEDGLREILSQPSQFQAIA